MVVEQTTYLDNYGNVLGRTTQKSDGTLSIKFDYLPQPTVAEVDITPYGVAVVEGGWGVSTFGPNSASGGLFALEGPVIQRGNYDVTYRSILPNGDIDTAGGLADVDMTSIITGGIYPYTEIFVAFQIVPEPSALVQVAVGLLVLACFLGVQAYRARRSGARAIAAAGPAGSPPPEVGVAAAGGPCC
jgi:hypothetical protein